MLERILVRGREKFEKLKTEFYKGITKLKKNIVKKTQLGEKNFQKPLTWE